MGSISSFNPGVKYLLGVVDNLTKFDLVKHWID